VNVVAYCARSWRAATRKAAGVLPLTCPPTNADTLPRWWLNGHDLIWIDLHGAPDGQAWYGDDHVVALRAEQLAQAELGGAVVFATTCYLADAQSPMLDALLTAGARYVIAGEGPNYGGADRLLGTGLLGLWLRGYLALGLAAPKALALAKQTIRVFAPNSAALRDTLAFRIYERRAS